jgi:hypothetical protein
MLPPRVADYLNAGGHDAVSPAKLGAHNLPDDTLIELAAAEQRVIVTENAGDFAGVTTCSVLIVRKSWWPRQSLASSLALSVQRWAAENPAPGLWAHWLEAGFR